ncbi:MAG: InlB B-repeat-containing protein, partial [Gammaproteobacteria bacterium]
LRAGTNFFVIQATDAATNTSLAVTRRFIHVVYLPFTNEIVGAGSVSPDYNGRLLEVGRRYTITAVPATSNLFAFWSGGATSAVAKLTFTMRSNFVLAANFVANPFLPILGSYTGLFSEPSQSLHETSGYFSAKLAARGSFSASLRRAGRTLRWSGQFALDGKATNTIRLSATNQLLVTLCLDLTNGTERITGPIAEGDRIVELLANRTQPRSATNPAAPYAGKYSLSFVPETGVPGPAGASLAAISADTNGNLKLSGFLADGTKLTAKGAVSKDGLFPLQQPLYSSKGSILSWLIFTNTPGTNLVALANWTKPTRPADNRYPGGFTNLLAGFGVRYSLSELTNDLAAMPLNAVAVGALPTPDTTNAVVWSSTLRRMTNAVGMTVTLNAATGLWDGIYPESVSRQRLPFKTTLHKLADHYLGLGHIIQSNITGTVVFGPVP